MQADRFFGRGLVSVISITHKADRLAFSPVNLTQMLQVLDFTPVDRLANKLEWMLLCY